MKKPLFLLCLAVAVAALAGCSDNGVGPKHDPGTMLPFGVSQAIIGPSEIVFCIDVSDSISAGELTSIVSGLGGCLADQTLIPQNGQVTVVLTAYADSVKTILNATPVTAATLQNAIQPALQGLLTTRPTTGGAVDLAGALQNALTILQAATIADKQVLVAGSGAAANPAAVTTAAQALAAAHVSASCLAVGADAAGVTLLQGTATATGGFFASGVECADALSYMLQVRIDLEPKAASLHRNLPDTLTASVFRDDDASRYPLAGLVVVFDIVSGPNAPRADTTTTDASGEARFVYMGTGGPGTDVVVGSVVHPGTGVMLTDTATVTWINAPPVCDANGPYTAVVTTDVAQVQLTGAGSSDADGDSLRFHWGVLCGGGASFDNARAVSPVLTLSGDCLCVDSLMVLLTVSDGFDSTTCQSTVRIEDLRPPIVVMKVQPVSMWPPNHKYRTIAPEMLVASVTDACGRPIPISSALVVQVSSDEPDDAKGSGKTAADIAVTCPNRVDLRVERMGGGNGRVYTIVYRFFTENGVSADGVGRAVVPHDASGKAAIDDGSSYVVTPGCGQGRLAARDRGR